MTEQIHRVRGRLDVALDLIDKATMALLSAGSDRRTLEPLFEAAAALGAATASIDDVLTIGGLGPAA